jgi:hypothetical protein
MGRKYQWAVVGCDEEQSCAVLGGLAGRCAEVGFDTVAFGA